MHTTHTHTLVSADPTASPKMQVKLRATKQLKKESKSPMTPWSPSPGLPALAGTELGDSSLLSKPQTAALSSHALSEHKHKTSALWRPEHESESKFPFDSQDFGVTQPPGLHAAS